MLANSINSLNNNKTPLDPATLALAPTPVANSKTNQTLNQADFLKLLTTQMKNQDPTKPQDNAQFASQIAQFGTLDSVQQLKSSFDSFSTGMQSSRALQASSLVGRSVIVKTSSMPLQSGGTIGSVNLTGNATDLQVGVYNSAGALVKTIPMGAQSAGAVLFKWDGTTKDGDPAPYDTYQFKSQALVSGKNQSYDVSLAANVESVLIGQGQNGIKLNLSGIGQVGFDQVTQIG